jgi:predicted Fe-Mo cluster-binding NifX family protein
MKVGIPCTDATGEQARLSIPYGQAPFFALWDAATDRLEFQSNPLAGQDHACACATTHWLQRLNAGVLITADIGRRVAQRLTEAGIEVLQAPIGNLGELLAWYRHGSLVPAPAGEPLWLQRRAHQSEHCSQPDAAYRHHGGQGQCCREHEGRHGPEPQGQGGHHHHGGQGRCCREHEGWHGPEPQGQGAHHHHGGQGQCCGEHQGRPVQGHRGRGDHGSGCCHSA